MLGRVKARRRQRQQVGLGDVTGFVVDVNLAEKQISLHMFTQINICAFVDRLTSRGASVLMNSS